jgi:BirA family biotin operon repressor/biotin-[acetyl-CoA-carboxylase] ligase
MSYSPKWLGKFHLLLLEDVDSTNSEAKRISILDPSAGYLVICAKKQSLGRGRYGKSWSSPEGNFYCSIIIPKTSNLDLMAQLSFVASVALEEAISSFFYDYKLHKKPELKWPNDILIDDKKVSGILLETAGELNEYVVIGVGANLQESPSLQEYKTTSLREEGINFIDVNDFLDRFMSNFYKLYCIWLADGFLPIREKWLKKAKGKGKIVNVNTGTERISGKFLDLDLKGGMRIQLASGHIYTLNNGEVFFAN